MRVRRILAVAAAVGGAFVVAQGSTMPVMAADDELVAEAEEGGDSSEGETGETVEEAPYIVSCTYTPHVIHGNGQSEDGEYVIVHIDASRFRFHPPSGGAWIWAYEICLWSDGAESRGSVWQPIAIPDPTILIPGAYDRVVERIESPEPALSPAGPGVINLGMWLATDEPVENPVVARAEAGTSWAEVTGTLDRTVFDFGNGDTVTCAGFGVPIPDDALDTVDEGPCGYTFERVDDIGEHEITVTAVWEVTYVLSNGSTGSEDDIELTVTVPYEVFEIQTVGRGN